MAHPLHPAPAHGPLLRHRRQLAIPRLATRRPRPLPHLRQVRGPRQHQPRRHPRPLRHLTAQVPAQDPQHLRVHRRRRRHHRLRRVRRRRGSHRARRLLHRFQGRTGLPSLSQAPHDTRRLRSRRRHRRHLPSAHRRHAIHPRSVDDRPHRRHRHAPAHRLHHQRHRGLLPRRLQRRVLLHPVRALPHLQDTLRAAVGRFHRIRQPLLLQVRDDDGRSLPPSLLQGPQVLHGRRLPGPAHLPLPAIVRRGLRLHQPAAGGRPRLRRLRHLFLHRPRLGMVPGGLHRRHHPLQGLRHRLHQRSRRGWRHLCPVAVRRRTHRLSLRLHLQPAPLRHGAARTSPCSAWPESWPESCTRH